MRWDYPHVWAYLWDKRRHMWASLFGIVWCIFWTIWWADAWYWRVLFVGLALMNLAAMSAFARTYYQIVKPHQEWRRRLEDGVVIPWDLSPDEMRVEFRRSGDEPEGTEGPGAGPEAPGTGAA